MTPPKVAWFTAALLVMVLCCKCRGDKIQGVCTDVVPKVNQTKRPEIPNQFKVKVECKLLERNMTSFVTEWYDYSTNIARIRQQQGIEDGDLIYDYAHNELLSVDRYNDGACTVKNLSGNENNFLFGINSTGREHVLAPPDALHLADSHDLYLGSGHIVRGGIIAEAWTSCQYSSILDATMNVTWYFSAMNQMIHAKTHWDMQLGVRSVPVRAVVVGKMGDNFGTSHNFNHIYDLYEFTPSIEQDVFQLRPGDYCPGRINTKPFPKIPKVFSVVGETQNNDRGQVQTIEEHYDSIKKLTVFTYKDSFGLAYLSGANAMTEVNDYHSGYAFMINNDAESCQIRLVSEGEFTFAQQAGGGKVVQQSASRIFLVQNVSWEYGGVKTERGMQCDTWVGRSDQTYIYPGINVTVEYAFAVKDHYTDWNFGSERFQMPVSMKIWKPHSDGSAEVSHQYNAFAFTANEPKISTIDLSPCFHGVQRVNIRFRIGGKYNYAVTHNVQGFKAGVMNSFSDFLGISVLRTADVRVYLSATDILVSLDLLDKPAFSGDSAKAVSQNSLDDAIAVLTSPAVVNAFQIAVNVGGETVIIIPKKNYERILYSNGTCTGNCNDTSTNTGSNTGTTPGTGTGTGTTAGPNDINVKITVTSGYSGGSLAGLGIAMLLIGGGIGSGGGFVVFGRKRSQRFH